MVKILKVLCVLVLLLFVAISIIGKNNFEHITYLEYTKQSKYYPLENHYYDFFPKQKGFFIDDSKIKNKEQLINQSEYALIVKVEKENLIHGTSIINDCTIIDIIKGDKLSIGEKIKIYDVTYGWSPNSTEYFGSMTPMKPSDSYFVFIKKAPSPTLKDSYVFSSLMYGHFKVDPNTTFLTNYTIEEPITIEEAMEYDYILANTDKENITFQKIKSELISLTN